MCNQDARQDASVGLGPMREMTPAERFRRDVYRAVNVMCDGLEKLSPPHFTPGNATQAEDRTIRGEGVDCTLTKQAKRETATAASEGKLRRRVDQAEDACREQSRQLDRQLEHIHDAMARLAERRAKLSQLRERVTPEVEAATETLAVLAELEMLGIKP